MNGKPTSLYLRVDEGNRRVEMCLLTKSLFQAQPNILFCGQTALWTERFLLNSAVYLPYIKYSCPISQL